jgi:DNA-binding transcriptional regulator YiaG
MPVNTPVDIFAKIVYVRHMDLATDLRVARARLKEDQQTFARRLGIDRSVLSRWENGILPVNDLTRRGIKDKLLEIEHGRTELDTGAGRNT